jgi:hypothetical protein
MTAPRDPKGCSEPTVDGVVSIGELIDIDFSAYPNIRRLDRPGDVLDGLLPARLDFDRDLVAHLLRSTARYVDAAGVRQRLDPGSWTCFWTSIAQVTASTALANSTSAPSPISLKIRPEWAAIRGSKKSRLIAFNRASVPVSSIPMRREYPTTSADRIAASLLWTRPSAIQAAPPESRDPIRLYGSLGGVSIAARMTDLGQSPPKRTPPK